ncbi:MAG TPA: efflux RND transporter periplasmic adaptor subunit [Verrucomicrobiae bacterium]|jgi:multidrug efflux pump subunit AcrA (membrane-fusion protein)|nr:efflux RND transporter periplasmic adaptor subunit [Verrucomicrobiae bacterium]
MNNRIVNSASRVIARRLTNRGLRLFVGLIVMLSIVLTGCNRPASEEKPAGVDYYTCTMHPSVRSQDPRAKCPICSMDLVPVVKKLTQPGVSSAHETNSEETPSEFTVAVERQQQIGVTYAVVEKRPLVQMVRLGGIAATNDSATVLVWAQFYQEDLPIMKPGLSVTITTSAYPGEKFAGRVSSVESSLDNTLHTARARIEVAGASSKLRAGMYVDADLVIEIGDGLAAPVSAVVPMGRHDLVFIDKGGGRLAPRYVELGRKCGEFYEVKSGLVEHERVVTSANFLIDAEANVQGAIKSW